MGYTGKDPDVKTFDNGGVVAQFPLATTKRGFKTKDGKEIPGSGRGTECGVRYKTVAAFPGERRGFSGKAAASGKPNSAGDRGL